MSQLQFNINLSEVLDEKVKSAKQDLHGMKVTTELASVKSSVDDVDSSELQKRLQAFEASFMDILINRLAQQVSSSLNNAMDLPIWDWPRATRRKSGETVTAPRNIVDTGALKASLFIQSDAPDHVSGFYDSPYARLVHYGGYVTPYSNPAAQAVYVPGRPWIKAALKGSHGGPPPKFKALIQTTFVEEWNRNFA